MLTLIEGPQSPAITLAEIKDCLRIRQTNTSRDADLERIADGAIAELDGPSGCLRRALVTQRWSYWLKQFSPVIKVPLPPLQAAECIKYRDTDGAWQDLASSEYEVTGIGGADRAEIRPAFGKSWPSTAGYGDGYDVEVQIQCGYGDSEDIPGDLKNALLTIVGIRSSVTDGLIRVGEQFIPMNEMPGLEALSRYKVYG